MIDKREMMLSALSSGFAASIERHKVNMNLMLDNYVGVAEHPDVMETLENELEKIARYQELLDTLNRNFN